LECKQSQVETGSAAILHAQFDAHALITLAVRISTQANSEEFADSDETGNQRTITEYMFQVIRNICTKVEAPPNYKHAFFQHVYESENEKLEKLKVLVREPFLYGEPNGEPNVIAFGQLCRVCKLELPQKACM
jgi:hypothetical protein